MTNATKTTAGPLDPDTAASIRRLVDVHEAIDALYRFGAGQDLGDRALFESAFAPNAVVDFTQPAARLGVALPPFEGRDAVTETIMGAVAALDTTHTVTNPRVRLDGDRAELFALVEAQHLPKADHRRHLLLKNVYRLALVRDGARWVIERMTIENVWLTGDPTVLFPSPGE
jgi:hypothetical protein